MPLRKEESFEKFLVRTILFIDDGKQSIGELTVILATLRGRPDAGKIDDARVSSLDSAQEYIDDKNPYVSIIDPSIAPAEEVLEFIDKNRTLHPRLTWVINAHRNWWSENQEFLNRHRLGERLRKYYQLNKDVSSTRRGTEFVNTLAQCHFDFVLGLLGETTEEMREGAIRKMTRDQIIKFFQKALGEIRSLNRTLLSRPAQGEMAFVSMQFNEEQRAIYSVVIERVLAEEGLTPVMVAEEFPSKLLVPPAIFDRIEKCSLLVADLTGLRSNVMIEIGAAWVLQKPIIFLADESKVSVESLPFLLKNMQVLFYESQQDLLTKLRTAVRSLKSDHASHRHSGHQE